MLPKDIDDSPAVASAVCLNEGPRWWTSAAGAGSVHLARRRLAQPLHAGKLIEAFGAFGANLLPIEEGKQGAVPVADLVEFDAEIQPGAVNLVPPAAQFAALAIPGRRLVRGMRVAPGIRAIERIARQQIAVRPAQVFDGLDQKARIAVIGAGIAGARAGAPARRLTVA